MHHCSKECGGKSQTSRLHTARMMQRDMQLPARSEGLGYWHMINVAVSLWSSSVDATSGSDTSCSCFITAVASCWPIPGQSGGSQPY